MTYVNGPGDDGEIVRLCAALTLGLLFICGMVGVMTGIITLGVYILGSLLLVVAIVILVWGRDK